MRFITLTFPKSGLDKPDHIKLIVLSLSDKISFFCFGNIVGRRIIRNKPGKKSSDIKLLDIVLDELKSFHGANLNDLNIAKICTGDYFTTVELTDGSQGAGSNLLNMHGPYRKKHDYIFYDEKFLRLSKTDKLLKDSILYVEKLDPLEMSVKLAILNALSFKLLSPDRLHKHNLCFKEGFFHIEPILKSNDTVTMIGCMGNYSCWEIGKVKSLKQIFFSEFEYVDPYKEDVESFVRQTFHNADKVIISDGRENKEICKSADVVIITSDTLCTNTLDDLLKWSGNAREILVVGWCYAMDPLILFKKGVSVLSLKLPVHSNLVDFTKEKLCKDGIGYTDSFIRFFKRGHICA